MLVCKLFNDAVATGSRNVELCVGGKIGEKMKLSLLKVVAHLNVACLKGFTGCSRGV